MDSWFNVRNAIDVLDGWENAMNTHMVLQLLQGCQDQNNFGEFQVAHRRIELSGAFNDVQTSLNGFVNEQRACHPKCFLMLF